MNRVEGHTIQGVLTGPLDVSASKIGLDEDISDASGNEIG